MRASIVWLLFLFWAALVLYGFYVFQTTAPTGDGFTRGYNRLEAFFKWELIALGVGVATFVAGRGLDGAARWAGRAPLILSGGFFLLAIAAFAGLMIYTRAQ